MREEGWAGSGRYGFAPPQYPVLHVIGGHQLRFANGLWTDPVKGMTRNLRGKQTVVTDGVGTADYAFRTLLCPVRWHANSRQKIISGIHLYLHHPS
jgi:hypothetical protein